MPDPTPAVTPAATTPPPAAPPAASTPAPAPAPAAPAAAPTSLLGTAPAAPATPAATPAEGQKPGEVAPAGIPAEYNFKVPEGFTADPAALEAFKPVAKKLGLSQEAGQELVDLFAQQNQARAQRDSESLAQHQRQLIDQAKSDKEFGGPAFNANIAIAQKALTKYGGEALTNLLNATGLGNHPALIGFAYRVGKAMAEDSVAGPTAGANGQLSTEERHRLLFPSMFQPTKD